MGLRAHAVDVGCVGDGGETMGYVRDMSQALRLKMRNPLEA